MPGFFRLGGWPMFVVLAFGLVTIVIALQYAMRPERRFVPLLVSLGVVTLLSGAAGFTAGLTKSLVAIEGLPDSMRWIWLVGLGESLMNVVLALFLTVVAALAATVGAYRLSTATH
jgi:hypothetical protein